MSPEPGRALDAVCPLTARDLDRFTELLVPSIQKYFDALGTCWVIAPARDVATIDAVIDDPRFRVVTELDVAPELARALRLKVLRHPGWYVQQILKLGAVDLVTTPQYLTLDADIICMRPTGFDDLVVNGKAVCQLYDTDFHPKWERWAKRVLGLPKVQRHFNVTPAVLSTSAVRELTDHLDRRNGGWRRWMGTRVNAPELRDYFTTWRGYALSQLPWTEYRLYFNFLEATGRLEQFHHIASDHVLHRESVWKRADFDTWHPAPEPSPDESCFVVVQSTTNVPVAEIKARLGERL